MSHEQWRAKYSDTNTVPGGESLVDLENRAQLLLDTLARNYVSKRVLAVSHGALIRVLLRIVSQGEFPRDGERLGNACLSILFTKTLSGESIPTSHELCTQICFPTKSSS